MTTPFSQRCGGRGSYLGLSTAAPASLCPGCSGKERTLSLQIHYCRWGRCLVAGCWEIGLVALEPGRFLQLVEVVSRAWRWEAPEPAELECYLGLQDYY